MSFKVRRVFLPHIKEPISLLLDLDLYLRIGPIQMFQSNALIGITLMALEDKKVVKDAHLLELVLRIDKHLLLIVPENDNVV